MGFSRESIYKYVWGTGELAMPRAEIEHPHVIARRVFDALCERFPDKYIALVQPRSVGDDRPQCDRARVIARSDQPKQCRDLSAARALVLENAGCDMMETAPLTSSSADFEDMITQFRHRLRPPPALTLADWLRVNLGLSGATEDFDFPPRNEVHRQLRAVLRAVT